MNASLPSVPVLYPFSSLYKTEEMPSPLLFSCPLCALGEEDAASLVREGGLGTVVDLRTDGEEASLPDVQIPGVLYLFAPLPPLAFFPDREAQARAVLSDKESLFSLRRVFDVLLHREGTVLVHCADGHERCDLISSLLLALLGEEAGISSVLRDECGGAEAFFRDRLGYRDGILPLLREKFGGKS